MYSMLMSAAADYFAGSKLLSFLAAHKGLAQFLMLLDYTSFLKSGVSYNVCLKTSLCLLY